MNQDLSSTGSATIPGHSTGIGDGSPGLQQSTEQVKQSAQAEFQKMKGAAQEQTAAAVEQMKEKAQNATRQAKEMGSTFFQSQKRNVVHRVEAYAQSARTAAECLRTGEGQAVAGAVSTAAAQLTRVSDYLREKEPTDLVRDLEQFARRRPELVFGGMFLLGLATSRFLKASTPRVEAEQRYSGADYYMPGSAVSAESISTYASRSSAPEEISAAVPSSGLEEPFAPAEPGSAFTHSSGGSTAPLT